MGAGSLREDWAEGGIGPGHGRWAFPALAASLEPPPPPPTAGTPPVADAGLLTPPPFSLGAHSPTARAASSKIPNTHSTTLLALIRRPGAASKGGYLILPQQLPY